MGLITISPLELLNDSNDTQVIWAIKTLLHMKLSLHKKMKYKIPRYLVPRLSVLSLVLLSEFHDVIKSRQHCILSNKFK